MVVERKIGDNYKQITLGFFEWLCEGNDDDDYIGKQYYDTTIKYITKSGSFILEINEEIIDGTFDTSLFNRKEIKKYYPDFDGDDKKKYCVLYEEDSPFY